MRAFLIGILGNIVSNVIWLGLAAAAPSAVLLLVVVTGLATPTWFSVAIGGIWSVSTVSAAVWYWNHKDHIAKRMLDLATLLLVPESTLLRMLILGTKKLSRYEAEVEIRDILWKLCGVLAYRIQDSQKGATFLILNDTDKTFSLFAQVRHDDRVIPYEIRQKLSLNAGLAGQALRENRCIVLRDCRKTPAGVSWVDTHNPPRFRGRAVAPVQIYQGTTLKQIGVLCFDIKVPWEITQEEEHIMNVVADRIACIWQLSL